MADKSEVNSKVVKLQLIKQLIKQTFLWCSFVLS